MVVTCWNGRILLEKNIPFLVKAFKNPSNKIKELIVVDDASVDDSVVFLKKEFPFIKIIAHKDNLGYSAVCNSGIKAADNDLVAILNLDVVPKEDFLRASLPHFEDGTVFAVTFNEGKYGPGKLKWQNGFLEIVSVPMTDKVSLTDWPNGGSSVFKKQVWEKLRGMDEIYLPFYFEDIDLGIRAGKAGYKCLWEPDSKVEHKHEATINKENFRKYGHKKPIELIKQRNHLILTWRNIDSGKLLLNHLLGLFKKCISHPKYMFVLFSALKRYITVNQ